MIKYLAVTVGAFLFAVVALGHLSFAQSPTQTPTPTPGAPGTGFGWVR